MSGRSSITFTSICTQRLFAHTHCSSRQSEHALTEDANKKQLPSLNTVSLALDGWTSTNKIAILSVIAYYMDRSWALREAQLALNEVDRLYFSPFECQLRLIGQGLTYWIKASCAFEEHAWSFWAYRLPVAWNYDRSCFLRLLNDSWAAINTWGPQNPVACIEEPHNMHSTHHLVVFRCIHERLGVKSCTKSWKAHEHNQQFGEN